MGQLSWILGLGAVGTLMAACWALVERVKRAGAEGRMRVMEVELTAAKAQAADGYRQFKDLQAQRDEERGRLEGLVIQLKRDAALAWESYGACVESGGIHGDVGVHLQRMLSTPIGTGATTASAIVPTEPTT